MHMLKSFSSNGVFLDYFFNDWINLYWFLNAEIRQFSLFQSFQVCLRSLKILQLFLKIEAQQVKYAIIFLIGELGEKNLRRQIFSHFSVFLTIFYKIKLFLFI